MKRIVFSLLACALVASFGLRSSSAIEADFSESVLLTDPDYPDHLRISNVEILGNYYWGLFRWNPDLYRLDIVDAGWEAGEAFEIPTRTITLDGGQTDWSGLSPVLVSPAGNERYDLPGDDIRSVYLARDEEFMYFGIQIGDGAPLSAGEGHMHFQFSLTAEGWSDLIQMENRFVIMTTAVHEPPNWSVDTALQGIKHPDGPVPFRDYDPATHLGVGPDFVEWKVPIEDCLTTSGRFAEAWTHYDSQPGPSDVVKGVRIK